MPLHSPLSLSLTHDVASIKSNNSSAASLGFIMTQASPLRSRHATFMTTGQVENNEANKSPARPPNLPLAPPAKKVENRPEVVGGLPLWLTLGVAGRIRRLTEMFNFTPFAARRRDAIAKVEQTFVQNEGGAEPVEYPVGRAMRRMADVMEEEMASLRMSIGTMKAELARSQHEAVRARKQLNEVKMERERLRRKDSERALSMTMKQLWSLHAREQTRTAAAEKKLSAVSERLQVAERRNEKLERDLVQVSVMYTTIGVVALGFLLGSPFWSTVVENMTKGGR